MRQLTRPIYELVQVIKHILTSSPLADFVLQAPDRLHQIYVEYVYGKKVNDPTPFFEKK